mgnify:CR=1 FL=1
MNAGAYGKIRAMPRPHPTPVPTPAEAAQWAPERVVELAQAHAALQREVQTIQHQLEWFRRQLFGQKSEKRPLAPHPAQMHLGELPIPDAPPEPPGKPVAGHTRRTPRTDFPPRQNSCHLDRILNSGAMMRERVGAIRTRIQRQSGGAVAAAGERSGGVGCA